MPASVAGRIIAAAAGLYAIYIFIDTNNRSTSIGVMLSNFVFSLLIIGLVYTLIAFFTEKRPPSKPAAD